MKRDNQLNNEELAFFCSQIGVLLKAGVTPLEALRILGSDTEDEESKELLNEIIAEIGHGNKFSAAIEKVGVFPDYVVSTLKLGEEAGTTDEVMGSLADYYDNETRISENIKSAITYPAIMIGMMLLVIVILITKVLPIFNQVFVQLGSEMTGFAASLLVLGNTLNKYSIFFLSILVIIIALFMWISRRSRQGMFSKALFRKLPMAQDFYDSVAAGRFARGMAIATNAGLDTYSSLDLVSRLVENEKYRDKIEIMREAIKSGDNLAEGIKKAGIFSNVNSRMVAVGIKSGEIDTIMRRIADEYERKSEKKISNIISIIEPTLVIILSLIVGLILLSVILPLMGIMSSIG